MDIRAAGISDVGCVRKQNEDSFLVDPALGLFVVADGLGGHAAGEIASQIVVETVARFVAETVESDRTWPVEYDPTLSYDGNRLKVALLLSDQAIADDIRQNPERETMGSTVVAGLFHGQSLTLAHVGDSRAYLLDREGIRQVTRDHSWVAEQVANGILTPSEARVHPFRNVITQALGNGGDLDVEIQTLELSKSERLLLCSDGLSGMIGDKQIWDIVAQAKDIQQAVESLISKAREHGGEDNITAVLVGWDSEEV
ncbi:Stp1/IreP family PP2C-type Ser/Thr phosphatase [Geothrix sp. PMB-07]|uniref:Stp1/IreP family PP2C-type Ser/Thr phosphatase n=1 Tax=Geothrix sp. PMB-07 TaxID=3068640 RepID=UPI002740A7ED|nr:Stp1/IreP family PP2C-type Ser/Thr phosphatase [Geothrix sp. PMB-07]WLT33143.1 Stp1/IreP family PP2C-type Ser/Thr phosphatase [Geothrix sp. PMB-07]